MKNSLVTTPNILFAALSAVFFAFAFRPLPPPVANRSEDGVERHYLPSAPDGNGLSLRAQQYRQQLAMKLNRERIDTEYAATFASRPERAGRNAVASEDDLAFGVEAIRKHASADVPVDASLPEMQIRADVLRQRMGRRRGSDRDQFVAQYIANARAEGYIVTVDNDLNVEVVRGPTNAESRAPQSVGESMSGPASGVILAEFIRAPFCQ